MVVVVVVVVDVVVVVGGGGGLGNSTKPGGNLSCPFPTPYASRYSMRAPVRLSATTLGVSVWLTFASGYAAGSEGTPEVTRHPRS